MDLFYLQNFSFAFSHSNLSYALFFCQNQSFFIFYIYTYIAKYKWLSPYKCYVYIFRAEHLPLDNSCCTLPRGRSPLSVLAFLSSLCWVEDSWACPCPLWHVHCCPPCSAHVWAVMLMSLYEVLLLISLGDPSHSKLSGHLVLMICLPTFKTKQNKTKP